MKRCSVVRCAPLGKLVPTEALAALLDRVWRKPLIRIDTQRLQRVVDGLGMPFALVR